MNSWSASSAAIQSRTISASVGGAPFLPQTIENCLLLISDVGFAKIDYLCPFEKDKSG